MHWPWGAGTFATSRGPDDACFVAGANWVNNSGIMCVWGSPCAGQKESIDASKVDECAFGFIGRCFGHFVHHTPVHLFGGGPPCGIGRCRPAGQGSPRVTNNLIKKCLDMFAEFAEKKDDYQKFYEQFGKCLKLVCMRFPRAAQRWQSSSAITAPNPAMGKSASRSTSPV